MIFLFTGTDHRQKFRRPDNLYAAKRVHHRQVVIAGYDVVGIAVNSQFQDFVVSRLFVVQYGLQDFGRQPALLSFSAHPLHQFFQLFQPFSFRHYFAQAQVDRLVYFEALGFRSRTV